MNSLLSYRLGNPSAPYCAQLSRMLVAYNNGDAQYPASWTLLAAKDEPQSEESSVAIAPALAKEYFFFMINIPIG